MTRYEGPIFDVQAHAVHPGALASTSAGITAATHLAEGTKQIIINDVLAAAADDLNGERRLAALKGDNHQVVSINMFFPALAPDLLLGIAEQTNTWLAQRASENPQLTGVATIPPPPPLARAGTAEDGAAWADKGVAVLRRAVTELGFTSVMFYSNYNDVLLGDAAFEPYFAAADELGVPVIIHPAVTPVDLPFVPRKNIPTFSGYLNDQRSTLLDLVTAGVLENHPDLTIIATHLGGGILTSLGRFEQLSARFPDDLWYISTAGDKRPLPRPISHYLKKIHYDCNNATAADIAHAIDTVGAGHLLTGTDFPWATDHYTRQVLAQLDATTAQAIAWDSASALFESLRKRSGKSDLAASPDERREEMVG
jgi:predicted TIM-barrel fold metal-dependent hydrolase